MPFEVTFSSRHMNLNFVLPGKRKVGGKKPLYHQSKHYVGNLWHTLQGFWNWCEWQGRNKRDDDFKGRTLFKKNSTRKRFWTQKGLASAAHEKPHCKWNAKKYLPAILGRGWQVRFPIKEMTTLTFRKLSPDSREKLSSVYPWGVRSCTQTRCQNKTKNFLVFLSIIGQVHTPWDNQLQNKVLGILK